MTTPVQEMAQAGLLPSSEGATSALLSDTDMARIYRRVTGAARWDESAIMLMREVEHAVNEKHGAALAAPGAAIAAREPTKEQIQSAFEAWVSQVCPSGDVSDVQRQWEASSDYGDLCASHPTAGGAIAAREQYAVIEDEIHMAWRGALKACGVSDADRDAITEVVRAMLPSAAPVASGEPVAWRYRIKGATWEYQDKPFFNGGTPGPREEHEALTLPELLNILASPSGAGLGGAVASSEAVDEATAMKGGRWVYADDIEHMAGELLSLATGDPYSPTKMVDAFHTLRAALASREQAEPAAWQERQAIDAQGNFTDWYESHAELTRGKSCAFTEVSGGTTYEFRPLFVRRVGVAKIEGFEVFAKRDGLNLARAVVDDGRIYIDATTNRALLYWEAAQRSTPSSKFASWCADLLAKAQSRGLHLDADKVAILDRARAALASQPGCAVEGEAERSSLETAISAALSPMDRSPWTEEHVKTYPRKAAAIINAALQVNSTEMSEGAKGSLTDGKEAL